LHIPLGMFVPQSPFSVRGKSFQLLRPKASSLTLSLPIYLARVGQKAHSGLSMPPVKMHIGVLTLV
jgi:hypothetical protein